MKDLEILHFEQLKNEVQAQYLKNHTPSSDEISKWKGIDIIYFQEDLRKLAKGNISEKTFYTYFKTSPATKVPRIDMLNLLSIYAGYASWYDFKKNHLFADEVLEEYHENKANSPTSTEKKELVAEERHTTQENLEFNSLNSQIQHDLQISFTDNQLIEDSSKKNITTNLGFEKTINTPSKTKKKDYLWLSTTLFLVVALFVLLFKDAIFGKTYVYEFTDADRNSEIRSEIDIKVLKENESPLYFRLKPGEKFYYPTKDKVLKMEITSPIYENLTISRNLESAPKHEEIELKPDDYKMALDYFSKKNVSGKTDDEIIKKRNQLNRLISDNAEITQIYDSDIYGVETLNKEKYITLVTTPTTSLKNLKMIEMKREKGKIVSIKFKISEDEAK